MQVSSWLPDGTAPPPALRTALAGVVDGWAARWFAARPPVSQPLMRGAVRAMTWHDRDGVMLGIAGEGLATVGARMLDVPVGDRGAADLDLLERIAEPCLDDLRTALARACGGQGGWRPAIGEPAWSAPVGDAPVMLALGLSATRFAALVRRHLPPVVSPPLGSAAAALAAQPVEVGAFVGRVMLNVADLAALVPGDVVPFDTALAAPLPLAIGGVATARGTASVIAADPAPFLRIATPLVERVSR